MTEKFYLSSQDFADDPEIRSCVIRSTVKGEREGSSYLLADIEPPLRTRFRDDAPRYFRTLILSLIGGKTIEDIGKSSVLADVIICPDYSDGLVDENKCSRIGVGSLKITPL